VVSSGISGGAKMENDFVGTSNTGQAVVIIGLSATINRIPKAIEFISKVTCSRSVVCKEVCDIFTH
jgi:hypothetical protein